MNYTTISACYCEHLGNRAASQALWLQISGKDKARQTSIRLGTSSRLEAIDSPRHSLIIGAEGRLVLHLVQLVHFMLLQRESNMTMDTRVGKAQA